MRALARSFLFRQRIVTSHERDSKRMCVPPSSPLHSLISFPESLARLTLPKPRYRATSKNTDNVAPGPRRQSEKHAGALDAPRIMLVIFTGHDVLHRMDALGVR